MTSVRERRSGRVLVLDPRERILLLQGFDPAAPGYRFWFTIGGGAEPGESLAQAAARELREESGIRAEPAALGQPVWRRTARFSYDGQPYRQQEEYYLLRTGPVEVTLDGLEDGERATVTAHRWWAIGELISSGEPFVPPELPAILASLNGGEPPR
ncbi:MAG TPA: NUDIX domain-containing protein [Streptosporangiaceae bacterium]|nr:NUDIX domain-containing protein [Streptosporangiaceae bacterium]